MKRKAIFLLYRILQALASPVILLYLLLRAFRNPRYLPTLNQRCGSLPPSWQQTNAASIWFHAVSVGEVLAVIPVLEEVRKRTPRIPLFLSTTTLAGRETAEKRLAGLVEGVFYAPFDFVWCVRRVLRRLRPTLVVVIETEIWPNMFRETKRLECGLAIVNGRISDHALPQYRRFASFFGEVLSFCDEILVQSEAMRERFEQAGAPRRIVSVAGNLKYDFTPAPVSPESPALRFIEADGKRPLWIAASTSADELVAEEQFVIEAQRQVAGWRLIIAPRKPERFEEVSRMLEQSGLRWARRSRPESIPGADVLLLDSIGELNGLFRYADAVLMGGTLANRGGHNILEPAIFGKPLITGPHMENFRDIAEHFEQHRALLKIHSGEELPEALRAAVSDHGAGERARHAAEAKRGAAKKTADAVLNLYDSRYPRNRHREPLQGVLRFLSFFWKAGSALDRHMKQNYRARLPVPVVSVGNITTGGTGKTPAVIELLRDFRQARPGIVTRGYGRSIRDNVLLLDPEDRLPVSIAGDEAQLCSRLTGAPVGIGADRWKVSMQLLDAAEVRIIFLDDGFQHLQLHRNFDLVLIDALKPFGGGELIPLGGMREPLEGLRRASAFLITRADEAPNTRAIENILRRWNPAAPVFRARTVPCQWRGTDGSRYDPAEFARRINDKRAIAFCGLGNPEAFWHTLKQTGINPPDRYAFADHHQYTPSDIRRLARHALDVGASLLLTTAKDAINLDPHFEQILDPLELYWLEVRTEIEHREDLIALVGQSVEATRSA